MKKIFISVLLLSMTFCFAACGGSGSNATTTEDSAADATTDTAATTDIAATTNNAATTDTAATDTPDADYNQLLTFLKSLNNHETMIVQLPTYRDQYDAGKLTQDDLIAAYQQVSDDSQLMLGQFQSAVWSSDTYKDQINLLSEALKALAQSEALNIEAITNNDEDKLNEADTYKNTYQKKFDALMTALGV